MLKQLFSNFSTPTESRFHIQQPDSPFNLSVRLNDLLSARGIGQDVVILCIGTDRSTGDSLGPLTGTKLHTLGLECVFGTLDDPVHATNLAETLQHVHQSFSNPFIIAVDACLGRLENVGYISLGIGPIFPGAAVNKNLPPVGDAYITGIVNVGGFMEHLVLQSTRLNLVFKMADAIAQGLSYSLQ